ncbi:Histone-lysine N-methyltransferase pr-set7 [Blattella germanica]|nr:Histone-lysine N-methyltransferase pr-set7 [Blattella germanica]
MIDTLDDGSSDAPKKKDSKLSREFQGKLSHASPQVSNQPITKFFSPQDTAATLDCKVNGDLPNGVSDAPVGRSLPRREANGTSKTDGDSKEKLPVPMVGRSPHKIQLCEDITPLSPSSALSQLRISYSPKRAIKSRRRLNPSQTSNQQVAPKSVPQLNCCNNVAKPTTVPKTSGNHKLTEYFPVRRSVRKTKRTVLEERQRDLEEAILSQREEGIEVVHNFEGKGRGVVTTRHFTKGEFVVEYAGELIDICEAKMREQSYAQDQNTGCYMYYFKNGNLVTKTVPIKNEPHLVLIAKEDIPPGEEVMYDYGDRSKESIRYHPWLAT